MIISDILTRRDIDQLVAEFYAAAIPDPMIGHHFNDLDLESHLPVMTDFWEKTIFGRPVYFGNPLVIHQTLHDKVPMTTEQFARWIEIFVTTVDRLFIGENANNAKLRARMIADSLNQRLNEDARISGLSNFGRSF